MRDNGDMRKVSEKVSVHVNQNRYIHTYFEMYIDTKR